MGGVDDGCKAEWKKDGDAHRKTEIGNVERKGSLEQWKQNQAEMRTPINSPLESHDQKRAQQIGSKLLNVSNMLRVLSPLSLSLPSSALSYLGLIAWRLAAARQPSVGSPDRKRTRRPPGAGEGTSVQVWQRERRGPPCRLPQTSQSRTKLAEICPGEEGQRYPLVVSSRKLGFMILLEGDSGRRVWLVWVR